jgi:hypothetical protein
MPTTYEPIGAQTLTANATSVTFSSIPQTYTDLVLITYTQYTSASIHCLLQFNSDTATNYSNTYLYGTGTSALSGRESATGCYTGRGSTTEYGSGVANIQNYSNSTTFKTVVSRGGLAGSLTIAYAGLWRNTNAISSLRVFAASSSSFTTGSTFTLYGIKAA